MQHLCGASPANIMYGGPAHICFLFMVIFFCFSLFPKKTICLSKKNCAANLFVCFGYAPICRCHPYTWRSESDTIFLFPFVSDVDCMLLLLPLLPLLLLLLPLLLLLLLLLLLQLYCTLYSNEIREHCVFGFNRLYTLRAHIHIRIYKYKKQHILRSTKFVWSLRFSFIAYFFGWLVGSL